MRYIDQQVLYRQTYDAVIAVRHTPRLQVAVGRRLCLARWLGGIMALLLLPPESFDPRSLYSVFRQGSKDTICPYCRRRRKTPSAACGLAQRRRQTLSPRPKTAQQSRRMSTSHLVSNGFVVIPCTHTSGQSETKVWSSGGVAADLPRIGPRVMHATIDPYRYIR